ncbi:MAG TPA: hypothetical protein VGI40_13070 [Pirellulaceae bacterium]|jgi:hypothetical protein
MKSILKVVTVLSAMAVAAGLIGCGSSKLPPAAQRLPGKWRGEMIVYEETQAKMAAEQVAALSQLQYDFEFRPDGSMVLSGTTNGQAFNSQGRWEKTKEDGDLLTIKSTEESGKQENVQIEFDGTDVFYVPFNAKPSATAEVAELGAMRFTRMR